ncbi:MAG: HD domain-containing protein [Syntrophobacteraceae bacterium]
MSILERFTEEDVSLILEALEFSASRHRNQRRKDAGQTPYINHPISVAMVLWRTGGVRDCRTIAAALLHDVIEDTDTRPEEIEELFGAEVLSVVLELSDDKRLPREDRKRLQIERARLASGPAKLVKIADKICNVIDITHSPPRGWSIERQTDYLDWTEKVVEGLKGCNASLEARYDEVLREGRDALKNRGE